MPASKWAKWETVFVSKNGSESHVLFLSHFPKVSSAYGCVHTVYYM